LAFDPSPWIRDSVFGESVDVQTSADDADTDHPESSDSLSVVEQVARLIAEARSMDNLADAYLTGWAPFL